MISEPLDLYLVHLVVDGHAQEFQCFADGFGHAEEQAEEAYPSGRICRIYLLPAAESGD